MSLRHRAANGAALVELALVLPLLMTVLVATADFARVFYHTIELTNAARAGAQWGAYNSARATQTANIQAAAQSAAPNIAPIVVNVSLVCRCAQNDGSGQPWPVITCGTACSAGAHVFETLEVQATKNFVMISRFVPAIPSTLPVTRKALMRVPL